MGAAMVNAEAGSVLAASDSFFFSHASTMILANALALIEARGGYRRRAPDGLPHGSGDGFGAQDPVAFQPPADHSRFGREERDRRAAQLGQPPQLCRGRRRRRRCSGHGARRRADRPRPEHRGGHHPAPRSAAHDAAAQRQLHVLLPADRRPRWPPRRWRSVASPAISMCSSSSWTPRCPTTSGRSTSSSSRAGSGPSGGSSRTPSSATRRAVTWADRWSCSSRSVIGSSSRPTRSPMSVCA